MPRIAQQTFSGGEIDPGLFARTDIEKYASSMAYMRNMFVHVQGGMSNRPGLQFVGHGKSDTAKSRLIPFMFNTTDTYILEFSANTMRVIRNGAYVLEDGIGISGISLGTTTTITTSSAHGFTSGDTVYFKDIEGTTQLNGRTYNIANVSGTAFDLRDRDNVDVDSSIWTTYTTGGEVQRYYTVSTEFVSDDLFALKKTQLADLMTIVHQDYHPKELRRSGHTSWTFTDISFEPTIGPPTALTATPSSTNSDFDRDSASTARATGTVTAISAANPAVLTFNNGTSDDSRIDFPEGTTIGLTGAAGTPGTEYESLNTIDGNNDPNGYVLKNRSYSSPNTTYELYSLDGSAVDTSSFTDTYTNPSAVIGKQLLRYKVTAVSADTGEESIPSAASEAKASDNLDTDKPCHLTWTAPASANVKEYNIYKEKAGVYGYIGTSETTEFSDTNIEPELGDRPPPDPWRNPFQKKITGITKANPAVVTCPEHGYQNGNRVYMHDIGGMTEIFDDFYLVANADGDTFELQDIDGNDIDSTAYTAYTSGGFASDWPGSVAYFSQRRVFANQYNKVETVHCSATGLPSNFNSVGGSGAHDAFSYSLWGSTVNEIRHLLPKQDLFLFTSGGVHLSTSGDNPFLLENLFNREQTTTGVSTVEPIKSKNSMLYIQDIYNAVRDLGYSNESNEFGGDELSQLIPHLLEGRTIVDWAYSEHPFSIVWCVLDNGNMLSLTYDKINRVFGWCQHDTDGKFESVAVVPEGRESAVYFVVYREIGGTWRRMVERFHTREFEQIHDAFFVDSGLSLDNPIEMTTMDTTGTYVKIGVPSHGLANNDQIEFDEVEGATELNLEHYRIQKVAGSTGEFWLVDRYLDDPGNIIDITQADPAVVTTQTAHGITAGDTVFISVIHDISGITQANPAVVTTDSNHGYANGDTVRLADITGMTELNDRDFTVANRTANTFELSGEDSTSHKVYLWGGTAQNVDGELAGNHYVVANPSTTTATVTGITQANPAVVTATAHGLSNGDVIYATDIEGMIELNNREFVVANKTDDTFELSGEDSTSHTAYTSGGTMVNSTFELNDFDGTTIDSSAFQAYTSGGSYQEGSAIKGTAFSPYVDNTGVIRKALSTVSGLHHLNGATVTALNDGNVENTKTVVDGAITLDAPGARVHVGLAYTSQAQTLPMDTPTSDLAGRIRDIERVVVKLFRTRSFICGPKSTKLTELPIRNNEDWNEAASLLTGEVKMDLEPAANLHGQVWIENTDPVPITVQAIAYEVEASDE